jgi:membrane-associated phospholipid phosphatase
MDNMERSNKELAGKDTNGEQTANPPQDEPANNSGVDRRKFLSTMLAGGAALAVAGTVGVDSEALAEQVGRNQVSKVGGTIGRKNQAFSIRRNAALIYLRKHLERQNVNGDEHLYVDFRASFFKTLPQNDWAEVDQAAFRALRRALAYGSPELFEAIPQSDVAERGLTNPQAAFAFEMCGPDAHATRMYPAPTFASALQAAEMGEVYWHALTRDIPFRHYDFAEPLVAAAVADLNAFSEPVGPMQGGLITPATLFRGETPGDLVGPYISQFLWMPINFGLATIEQQYLFPVAGDDFGTDYWEWLRIQRGAAPRNSNTFDTIPRYIHNGRALGEYVHRDVAFQAYLMAALIIDGFGPDALDTNNPYLDSENQVGFVTFGITHITDLVTKAANAALKAAWYQKWLVHRRLRPELFAGRVENQANGHKDYGIHTDVLNSEAVSRLGGSNGNYLLPTAYPEGSPTHPAYPAGHAAIAGACATILKAFFNEDYVIPLPVEPSADGLDLVTLTGVNLTLGDEINKLASNISLGRDWAGVHYRSDGIEGLMVGEQVATGILKDYSHTYNEEFEGFQFTRFDGTPVRIVAGEERKHPKRIPSKRHHRRWPVRETS